MIVTLSFLFPIGSRSDGDFGVTAVHFTFNRICLGQLNTVFEKSLWYGRPNFSWLHAKVNMSTGKVVGMELEMTQYFLPES